MMLIINDINPYSLIRLNYCYNLISADM